MYVCVYILVIKRSKHIQRKSVYLINFQHFEGLKYNVSAVKWSVKRERTRAYLPTGNKLFIVIGDDGPGLSARSSVNFFLYILFYFFLHNLISHTHTHRQTCFSLYVRIYIICNTYTYIYASAAIVSEIITFYLSLLLLLLLIIIISNIIFNK